MKPKLFNALYCGGGYHHQHGVLKSLEMMDLRRYVKGDETKRRLTWHVMSPLSEPSRQLNILVFNNILYSLGGERLTKSIEGYARGRLEMKKKCRI